MAPEVLCLLAAGYPAAGNPVDTMLEDSDGERPTGGDPTRDKAQAQAEDEDRAPQPMGLSGPSGLVNVPVLLIGPHASDNSSSLPSGRRNLFGGGSAGQEKA